MQDFSIVRYLWASFITKFLQRSWTWTEDNNDINYLVNTLEKDGYSKEVLESATKFLTLLAKDQ